MSLIIINPNWYTVVKLGVATMTKNHQIREIIVTPIKIDMMDLQHSFSFNTRLTMISKISERFFSIFNTAIPFIFAFIRAISEFTTIPVIMFKSFITCFTDRCRKFSCLRLKITIARAKNIFSLARIKFKLFKAVFANSKSIWISRFLGTEARAKTPLGTVRVKSLLTCFADFFHDPIIHGCVFWHKYTFNKKGVSYGLR